MVRTILKIFSDGVKEWKMLLVFSILLTGLILSWKSKLEDIVLSPIHNTLSLEKFKAQLNYTTIMDIIHNGGIDNSIIFKELTIIILTILVFNFAFNTWCIFQLSRNNIIDNGGRRKFSALILTKFIFIQIFIFGICALLIGICAFPVFYNLEHWLQIHKTEVLSVNIILMLLLGIMVFFIFNFLWNNLSKMVYINNTFSVWKSMLEALKITISKLHFLIILILIWILLWKITMLAFIKINALLNVNHEDTALIMLGAGIFILIRQYLKYYTLAAMHEMAIRPSKKN